MSMGLLYSLINASATHHLLCPWECFLFSQQQKSRKTFYLTNNSQDTLSCLSVSIYHIWITAVQHILFTDTAVPWLAQTTVFSVLSFSPPCPVPTCPKHLFLVKVTVWFLLQVERSNDWSGRMPEMWWYFVHKTSVHGHNMIQAVTLVCVCEGGL